MSRRVRSSGGLMSGAVCVLLASAAAGLDSPAHAECITQPVQQAPEGAHLYFDRARNRRCWILVDAAGRELSTAQMQPATTSSFLGNFTGAGPPEEATPAPAAPPPPRRHRVVNANRPARPPEPKTAARAARPETRHEMSQSDRDALFEEFLRWHESQRITGGSK
jgi:hypothetical protein